MKIQEDCYFYIDENTIKEKKTMSVLCINCYEKNPAGWHWPGKVRGYGPFDVNCTICNAFVNKIEKKDEPDEI